MPDGDGIPPETGTPSPPRLSWRPQLASLKSSRRTVARLIRTWSTGEISTEDARAMGWLLQVLLTYFRESGQVELSDRSRKIERRLKRLEEPDDKSQAIPHIVRD